MYTLPTVWTIYWTVRVSSGSNLGCPREAWIWQTKLYSPKGCCFIPYGMRILAHPRQILDANYFWRLRDAPAGHPDYQGRPKIIQRLSLNPFETKSKKKMPSANRSLIAPTRNAHPKPNPGKTNRAWVFPQKHQLEAPFRLMTRVRIPLVARNTNQTSFKYARKPNHMKRIFVQTIEYCKCFAIALHSLHLPQLGRPFAAQAGVKECCRKLRSINITWKAFGKCMRSKLKSINTHAFININTIGKTSVVVFSWRGLISFSATQLKPFNKIARLSWNRLLNGIQIRRLSGTIGRNMSNVDVHHDLCFWTQGCRRASTKDWRYQINPGKLCLLAISLIKIIFNTIINNIYVQFALICVSTFRTFSKIPLLVVFMFECI